MENRICIINILKYQNNIINLFRIIFILTEEQFRNVSHIFRHLTAISNCRKKLTLLLYLIHTHQIIYLRRKFCNETFCIRVIRKGRRCHKQIFLEVTLNILLRRM